MRSSILRAIIAIVIGVLLIMYRTEMVRWFTIAMGILFFIAGIFSIVSYYVLRKRYNNERVREEYSKRRGKVLHKPAMPIVGIGCTILGIILIAIPNTVADYLTYVFALLLILGAIGQFVILFTTMAQIRDYEKATNQKSLVQCHYAFWVLPTLLFLFGLLVLFYHTMIESAPFVFLGIAMIIYGLSEIVNSIKAATIRRHITTDEMPVEMVAVDAITNEADDIPLLDATPTEATDSNDSSEA